MYATADENALQIGIISPAEKPTPIAESQGSGVKWYLVKSRGGLVGWIKQAPNDPSKEVENFFKSLPLEPSALAVTMPRLSSAQAPRNAITVPVLSLGRASIVAVSLNDAIRAQLMLDTGATRTVISRRIANTLALPSMGSATVHTVGGPVQVTLAQLRSLKVGDAEVKELPVIVHDFSPDPRFEGLLGMDFLSRYKFGLDASRHLLVLAPR